MPRSKREYLRRYADQALNDLDRAIEKFHQLRGEYVNGSEYDDETKQNLNDDITMSVEGRYQNYIDAWSSVIQGLLQIRDIVQSMRDNNI